MLRDNIIKKVELRRKPISVPEWEGPNGEDKGKLFIRELTEAEFLQVQEDVVRGVSERRARHLVRILCDEDGKPILTPEDAAALANQPAGPVARIIGEWNEWISGDIDEQKKS